MGRILIAYSTTDGHTVTICQRLQGWLEAAGHSVRLLPVTQAGSAELAQCDKVVVAASIRYGKHKPEVAEFVGRHQAELDARPNAFFTLGPNNPCRTAQISSSTRCERKPSTTAPAMK